jgi:hypothetical protein
MLTPAEITEQQQMAIEAYESGEYLRFVQATMRLRSARPYEPRYMVGMVVGAARVGREKTAYSYMHTMQQQGLSHDFNSTEDTASIRGTEVYDYLNDLLIKAAEPSGEVQTAFVLPESNSYPEALAWDESSGRFLVGTLKGGKIYSIDLNGKVSKLVESNSGNGLRAIYGMAVDSDRKRLWVSSTATPAFGSLEAGELGRTALLEFNLETLELLNRFEPAFDQLPHLLGSIQLSPEGDVYVLDRVMPLVLVKPAGGADLEFLMANQQLTGLRDMAISQNGSKLYLADAELGIMVVDLKEKSAAMLNVPESLNLGAISGLSYSNGSLFMLQNGFTPQRLVRIDLSPAGNEVANVIPLASGMPEFDFPSFVQISADQVYYFAGSNLFGEKEKAFEPRILRSSVEPAEGMSTPEEMLIKERIRTE